MARSFKVIVAYFGFILSIPLFIFPPSYVMSAEMFEVDSISSSSYSQADIEQLFKKAMKDRNEDRYESSIAEFQKILSADPLLHRARLELAVAYYKILQYEEAIAQAKKVAADPAVPVHVKIAVLAFIAQSEKDSQHVKAKAEWRFPVSIGFIADDNVNIGPSSSILPTGFILDPESLPTSDNALELNIGLSQIYQTGKRFHIVSSPAMLYLLSGASIYQRNYFEEDTDITVFSWHTGPVLIGQRQWRALVSFQWDRILYANDPLADFYTTTSSFTWNFQHKIEATVDFSIGKRKYIGHANSRRDNNYYAPRILVGYTTLSKKFSFQFSAQYFNENASEARYTNNGTNLFVGVTWNVQKNSSLYGNYTRKDVQYDGFEPTFSINREDDQHLYNLGLSHKLTDKNSILNNWTIGVKTSITNNNSNITTTEYRRNQYSLTLSKSF